MTIQKIKNFYAKYLHGYLEGPHCLPNLMIIGAQKSGTSSLHHYIKQSKYILGSKPKELHYFDRHYALGLNWYKYHFPRLQKFKDSGAKYVFESTPNYLFEEACLPRIKRDVPDCKFIIILRNPVDRFISNYQHQKRRQKEHRSIDEVIEFAINNFSKNADDSSSKYLRRGIYVDQILRWESVFSKEKILVLDSEVFFSNPMSSWRQIASFLDIPADENLNKVWRNSGHNNDTNISTINLNMLENFYNPHNAKLGEYLQDTFGWRPAWC